VSMEPETCRALLNSLASRRIFSVTQEGITSRRMLREEENGKQTTPRQKLLDGFYVQPVEPKGKKTVQQKAKALQVNPPESLRLLVTWWNGIVKSGKVKGAVGDPPNLDVCKAWLRLENDQENREMIQGLDLTFLEKKIDLGGKFLKGWLTLAGLISGRTQDREELKLRKLLNGFYDRVNDKLTPDEIVEGRLERLMGGRV